MATPRTATVEHGLSGYIHRCCRCQVCTAARRDYDNERRRREREQRLAEPEVEHASREVPPNLIARRALLELGVDGRAISALNDWPQSVWRTFAAAHGLRWADVEPHGRVLTGGWSHDWVEEERGAPVDTPRWVWPGWKWYEPPALRPPA